MPVPGAIRQLPARGAGVILHKQCLIGRAVYSKFEAVPDDPPEPGWAAIVLAVVEAVEVIRPDLWVGSRSKCAELRVAFLPPDLADTQSRARPRGGHGEGFEGDVSGVRSGCEGWGGF